MSFQVYEEDLDEVIPAATVLLADTRSTPVDERRMQWLYSSNPDGPAKFWSIRQQRTGEMAGFTVCLPRRMLVEGEVKTCWNGADFSILPRFRALGVALKLRRAAKTAIDEGQAAFLYSHPNEKMQLIHERVGHFRIGEMTRYAKPLRTAPFLQRRLPGPLASLAGTFADPIATVSRAERFHRVQHETQVRETDAIDGRYDRLFSDFSHPRPITGVRDQRYLSWRYHLNPLDDFHVIEASDANRLVGYLIFSMSEKTVYIKDIFADQTPVVSDLIIALIKWSRRAKCTSVSFTFLDGSPYAETLKVFGFRRRDDSSSMFGYAPADSTLAQQIRAPDQWLIAVGDRDV